MSGGDRQGAGAAAVSPEIRRAGAMPREGELDLDPPQRSEDGPDARGSDGERAAPIGVDAKPAHQPFRLEDFSEWDDYRTCAEIAAALERKYDYIAVVIDMPDSAVAAAADVARVLDYFFGLHGGDARVTRIVVGDLTQGLVDGGVADAAELAEERTFLPGIDEIGGGDSIILNHRLAQSQWAQQHAAGLPIHLTSSAAFGDRPALTLTLDAVCHALVARFADSAEQRLPRFAARVLRECHSRTSDPGDYLSWRNRTVQDGFEGSVQWDLNKAAVVAAAALACGTASDGQRAVYEFFVEEARAAGARAALLRAGGPAPVDRRGRLDLMACPSPAEMVALISSLDIKTFGFKRAGVDLGMVKRFFQALVDVVVVLPQAGSVWTGIGNINPTRSQDQPGVMTAAKTLCDMTPDGTWFTDTITLDAGVVMNPIKAREAGEQDWVTGLRSGPADDFTGRDGVHEAAHALVAAGQFRAESNAREVLRRFYECRYGSLVGYERWERLGLSSYCFDANGQLCPDEAVPEGFSGVWHRGRDASEPELVLCALALREADVDEERQRWVLQGDSRLGLGLDAEYVFGESPERDPEEVRRFGLPLSREGGCLVRAPDFVWQLGGQLWDLVRGDDPENDWETAQLTAGGRLRPVDPRGPPGGLRGLDPFASAGPVRAAVAGLLGRDDADAAWVVLHTDDADRADHMVMLQVIGDEVIVFDDAVGGPMRYQEWETIQPFGQVDSAFQLLLRTDPDTGAFEAVHRLDQHPPTPDLPTHKKIRGTAGRVGARLGVAEPESGSHGEADDLTAITRDAPSDRRADELVHPLYDPALAVERAQGNRVWWSGLSDGQRQWWIQNYPAQIGNARGIPRWARHEANSLRLQYYLDVRDELRSGLDSGAERAHSKLWLLGAVDAVDAALRRGAEEARAAGVDGPYLEAFDPEAFRGVGRAIISFGDDPDTAESVSWHIPGRGGAVEDVSPLMGHALNQLRSALIQEPKLSAASMVWIGYDIAANDEEAEDAARVGGDVLYGDILASNAVRDAPANEHVCGHSVGGIVVQYAGLSNRLNSEIRTVTLMGVEPLAMPMRHASEFGPNVKVYVAALSLDSFTKRWDRILRGANVDPASREFGAQRIRAEVAKAGKQRRPQHVLQEGRRVAGQPWLYYLWASRAGPFEEYRTLVEQPGRRPIIADPAAGRLVESYQSFSFGEASDDDLADDPVYLCVAELSRMYPRRNFRIDTSSDADGSVPDAALFAAARCGRDWSPTTRYVTCSSKTQCRRAPAPSWRRHLRTATCACFLRKKRMARSNPGIRKTVRVLGPHRGGSNSKCLPPWAVSLMTWASRGPCHATRPVSWPLSTKPWANSWIWSIARPTQSPGSCRAIACDAVHGGSTGGTRGCSVTTRRSHRFRTMKVPKVCQARRCRGWPRHTFGFVAMLWTGGPP